MPSVLWAGARRKGPVRLCVAVRLDQYSFHLECGLPTPRDAFSLDPQMKEEKIFWHGAKPRQVLGRANSRVWARDADGQRAEYPLHMQDSESVLAEIREPHRYPELSLIREEMLRWRFYHHFRTDADAPIRQPQVGSQTFALSHDGRNLAAAILTILNTDMGEPFVAALADAFPGMRIQVAGGNRYAVNLWYPGFQRWFEPPELSDGTLQYLCLLAALLAPRPPTLIALNEPETSIHPDLVAPLAKLIVDASARTQLWITTHSTALADAIAVSSGEPAIQLEKVDGETRVVGHSALQRLRTI